MAPFDRNRWLGQTEIPISRTDEVNPRDPSKVNPHHWVYSIVSNIKGTTVTFVPSGLYRERILLNKMRYTSIQKKCK